MSLIRPRADHEPEGPNRDAYFADVRAQWSGLLAADPDEATVHAFIEQHPCLLPDPYKFFGRGHHGMITGLIYSKPVLPGPRFFVPDFMFVAMDSSGIFPTLVEIEAPGKAHATATGIASRDLEHARSQLRDWSDWFDQPENQIQFRALYGITNEVLRVRKLRPRYVLVYGRRDDALKNPRFARTRASSSRNDTIEMTYDRLEPSASSATAAVVRTDSSVPGELRFRAITVPPLADAHTFQFIDRTRVGGLEQALAAQPMLSPERKAWLLRGAGSLLAELAEVRQEQPDDSEPEPEGYDDDGESDD